MGAIPLVWSSKRYDTTPLYTLLPASTPQHMARTAVIAGVGPGLGASLAQRFAVEGCRVGLFARSAAYLTELADNRSASGEGLVVPTDLADIDEIRAGFATVREAFGSVDMLVNHASAPAWTGLIEASVAEFERAWAVDARGTFVCSQEAVEDTRATGGETIILTGATSAVRSLSGTIGFTAAKFAARGMAMATAQEFDPEGVRVAHVVIDGQIDEPGAR